MNRSVLLGFIGILMLVSLTVCCTADQSPTYIANIQGGESTITNGSSGMTITVQDVSSNVTITSGTQGNLTTIDRLTNVTYPLNAAVVFSGTGNESTSMVTISNLSLSDENKVLTLQVTPLKYYDGEELTSFARKNRDLPTHNGGTNNSTGIFVEIIGIPPTNWVDPCLYCMCQCSIRGYPPQGEQEKQCIQGCRDSAVCTSQVQA